MLRNQNYNFRNWNSSNSNQTKKRLLKTRQGMIRVLNVRDTKLYKIWVIRVENAIQIELQAIMWWAIQALEDKFL